MFLILITDMFLTAKCVLWGSCKDCLFIPVAKEVTEELNEVTATEVSFLYQRELSAKNVLCFTKWPILAIDGPWHL